MNDIVIARIQLISVLDDVKSLTYDLTTDELDALIEEVTVLYERFNNDINIRKGGQPE
jgi:hypothetical protein